MLPIRTALLRCMGLALMMGVSQVPTLTLAQSTNPWGGVQQEVAHGVRGQSFAFALWGDMPYARNGDVPKMPALLQSINQSGSLFSVFIGDIKDGASVCTDDQFESAIERFNSLVAPAVYVPGDNEWTDCHRTNNGGYNGLERLDHIRTTMFNVSETLGQRRMIVDHQGPLGGKFAENVRWVYGDIVFVGLNVSGSNNNKVNTPEECTLLSARTLDDCDATNAEYLERDAANVAWLADAFRLAKARGTAGVMVLVQADLGFDRPETATVNERMLPTNDGYTNFVDALVAETNDFAGQVMLVHGDTHYFTLDKPLIDVNNPIRNLTRLELFGSPSIHWVRVEVNPSSSNVFRIDPVYVPGN